MDAAARNTTLRKRMSVAIVACLASVTMGMDGCTPEGEGPIGELDGFPVVTFAPLAEDGEVVADVEIDRYLGLWYEVIVDLAFFAVGCTNTTAEYGPFSADTITVLNSCNLFDFDGRPNDINGFARVVDPAVPAKLSVNFGPRPTQAGAPYWIIELDGTPGDQPYEWAIVGGPTLDSLFVLTRDPGIDIDLANALLERLEERGYDLANLRYTAQDLG